MKNVEKQLQYLATKPYWAILTSHMDAVWLGIIQAITSGVDIGPASPETLAHVGARIGVTKVLAERFVSLAPSNAKPAIIPVCGELCNDDDYALWYGGTTYQSLQDQISRAVADPNVNEIILLVDSPGGDVAQLPETADMLASANKTKPVHAIVTGMAASAAYWLTSQARTITLTPSGEVGSVGVIAGHVDLSKMMDEMGVKVTLITAGKYKAELWPYAPLTDDAKAAVQADIDHYYGMFLGAIKKGRGARTTPETIQDNYGEGRMYTAPNALAAGMVDKVATMRDVFKARQDKAKQTAQLRAADLANFQD